MAPNTQQLDALNRARAAFEPGQEVKSPILNEFGNEMVRQLGKTRSLELLQDPGALATALEPASDIDGDGVPDYEEYLAGTLPTDPHHGPPWRLFAINLRRNIFHIAMICLPGGGGLTGCVIFHELDATRPTRTGATGKLAMGSRKSSTRQQRIRVLHYTWIAFITFYVWFNMAPLATAMLKSVGWLTRTTSRSAICNVALTIPRALWALIDRFGPRLVSVAFIVMSVPVSSPSATVSCSCSWRASW